MSAPLYTDDQLREMLRIHCGNMGVDSPEEWGMKFLLKDIEHKLAIGELRVVQKCTYDDQCSICGNCSLETGGTIGGFCPGCGSQVESRGYLDRDNLPST